MSAIAFRSIAVAAIVSAWVGVAAGGVASARADGALEALALEAGGKTHAFQVEVMRKDEDRARGLMFRRYMPADRGMLFDFKTEQPVSMWMRNTYLPLDMVFIARDGRVVSVAENTEPLSERIIPSGGAVLGVLEVNAGTAAKIGLKPGDRVKHPMFATK